MSSCSLKFGRYFEKMQLLSMQGFRTRELGVFNYHTDEGLCGPCSWIPFSPSFIWNMYPCQPSPSPPPTQMLLALGSEMKDWIFKIYVVTLEGFGSFAWTVGGPGMTSPLPDWYRLLLLFLQEQMCWWPGCSQALLFFGVTSVLKQGLWQWKVIPWWLPKGRVRKPFDLSCYVLASSGWIENIHS